MRAPAPPVRLFVDREDPCLGQLQVLSRDHVGLLFKLCELLTSHGIDICSAQIDSEDGIVKCLFELKTSRPSDFADAAEWCHELEELEGRYRGTAALEGSLASVSKRLSVNPDLLSVVSFSQLPSTSTELRYSLELEGINQAGLLTYAALVLCRCGFSVVSAKISTYEGHISDSFELATTSHEAENLLRSYLDVPTGLLCEAATPLPFHATRSDADLQAFMHMWTRQRKHNISSPFGSSPLMSRNGSFASVIEEDHRECNFPRLRRSSSVSDPDDSVEVPVAAAEPFAAKAVSALEGAHWNQRRRSLGAKRQSTLVETASSSDITKAVSSSAPPQSNPKPAGVQKKMSVQFLNGDVYSGNGMMFSDGEKRHGLGTYIYASGSHELYKQYRGQWREDKKHGYGVLFYRNGGVYVGQWIDNQKHGLGVLLDHTAEQDAAAMPSYRYEGIWEEDQPHGLGVEESDLTAYFGHFIHGQRQGRGVRMNLAKVGLASCEVMDSGSQVKPLFTAMENELAYMDDQDVKPFQPCCSTSGSGEGELDVPSVPATYHFANSAEANSRTSLAQLEFGWQSSRAESAAASVSTSDLENFTSPAGVSRTLLAHQRMPRPPSHADFGTPATPALGVAAGSFGSAMPRQRFNSEAASSEGLSTPLLTAMIDGNTSAMLLQGAGSPQRAASGGGDSGNSGSNSGGNSGHSDGSRISDATVGGLPTLAGAQLNLRQSPMSPPNRRVLGSSGGSVVFSLWEENDLLSPGSTRRLDPEPIPENGAAFPGHDGHLAPRGPKAIRRGLGKADSEPFSPEGTAGFGGSSGSTALPSNAKVPADQDRDDGRRRTLPLRRSPLLWSEDELAAFIACLGLNQDICSRVRRAKLKGVANLLEMSNSEMRRAFGLNSPVERLVVRQSLKRLLDADRWEHGVCGHKVGDILSDSVLSRYIVPMEELTLVTKISQGGYGTVYRGILDPKVDRADGKLQAHKCHLVAVKDMKGERRVRLYELLKEACVMASLSHPNICTFVGVCTDANARKHYIVSELMDCSLFDLIHQPYKLRWHGELTISLVVRLATGICSGVVYIHSKNLVHADLKSSNILIDYTSSSWNLVPRICDFGHAAVRSHPSPHHRCGTPHWAGPEVLRGEALGPAADIYSLGVIIWEMLAQKLPHKGLSFGQVLASVGWAGWTPDMSLLPELPTEVLQLVMDCLSFVPADRPQGKDVQRRLRKIPKQARLKALRMLASFAG